MSEETESSKPPSPEFATSEEDFARRLELTREYESKAYEQYSDSPTYYLDLQSSAADYLSAADFSPGDLVQWKPRMKNLRFPDYGKPAVYIAALGTTKASEIDDQTAEPTDALVGFLDGEGNFRVFPFTSARLTRWHPTA